MRSEPTDASLVLVVDDDPKFAAIAVRALERSGYRCVVRGAGDPAIRAVHDHDPGAVVLDVMIPPPDGLDVCRHLRADGWTGGIVMVSARRSPADGEAAVEAGADRFLGKPFPLAELVSAVDAVIQKS